MSPPPLGALVRALRPRQWIKNLLLAAAPAAAGTLDRSDVAWRTVAGMAVFVAASSATYLGNDIADAEIDRRHPTRRHRPVASGQLPRTMAARLSVALAVASLTAAFLLDAGFGAVVAAYLAINVWYSTGMKRLAGIELAAIASGFVLRAIGGGTVTATPLSTAFIVVVCAVSLVVVAGKRSAELIRTDGIDARQVLRHYSVPGLRLLRVGAAAVAVISYAAWVFVQDVTDDGLPALLAALSLLPFAGALAAYERALARGLGEDPEEILIGDRALRIAVVAWCLTYGAAINA